MTAREAGELASPEDGDRDTTNHRQGLVAAAQGTVEAFEAVFPHAVDGVDGFWLSKDFVKLNLNMRVQVVSVPIFHI